MGWISWFAPGLNIKRWLLLFTVGVIVTSISLAMIFSHQLHDVIEQMAGQVTVLFTGHYSGRAVMRYGVLGLIAGVICMIYATRRLVRTVVQTMVPEKNESFLEMLFTERKLANAPRITVIGGGTGLSTLLRGMKYITNNCTAVVTVADNGGSSGRLRQELGIIPPGDLRHCMTAMADREPLMERVMEYRFSGNSELGGHSFGNLFLAALAGAEGGMVQGLQSASQILKIRGQVLPSTQESVNIKAVFKDGTEIFGESEIPAARKAVDHLEMIPPNAAATESAVDAILNSDVLIFGPGSIYTSVIPNLLVQGIRRAILTSDAVKIYICNVMTQPGESDGYGAYEHVESLVKAMGTQFLDYVIVNDAEIPEEQQRQYRAKQQLPVTPDVERLEQLGIHVVQAKLISKENLVRHDPRKLAQVVMDLVYRLRLFGRGFVFFDYLFVRHNIKKLRKLTGG